MLLAQPKSLAFYAVLVAFVDNYFPGQVGLSVCAKSLLHKSLRQARSVLDDCGVVLMPFQLKALLNFEG